MHQDLAVKTDARNFPEAFLPVYWKKKGRHLTPICNLSSRGEVRPQLPPSATTFLVYSAKLRRQPVSGRQKYHYSSVLCRVGVSGCEYQKLCGSKTSGCMGHEKKVILVAMWVQDRRLFYNNNNNIYLTAIGSSPGGSGFCHVYKMTWNVHLNYVGRATWEPCSVNLETWEPSQHLL
jgi:hypothetical protein